MIEFSVVVATHNRPSFLARSLASVRAQGDELVQLIVVADAVCAASYAVAAPHLRVDDLFIQRGGHPGPAESRNVGLRHAAGRFVLFLDDDDALSPTFLRDIQPFLDERSVIYVDYISVLEVVAAGTSTILKAERRSLQHHSPADLLIKNFIPVSSLIYPRAVAQACAFDSNVGYEDWNFLLNVMSGTPLRHVSVDGPIIYSRPIADNRGGDNQLRLEEIYRSIYKRWPAPDLAGKTARQSFLAAAGIAAETSEL